MFPQISHNWVVTFQSNNRVHRNTRICTFIVFKLILHIPCIWFLPVENHLSISSSSLYPYPPTSSSTSLDTYISSPSCYHHLLVTQTPGISTVSSHRSRISRVEMYCAAILWLFRKHSTISLTPTPPSPSPMTVTTNSHPPYALVASKWSIWIPCVGTPPGIVPCGG